MRMFLDTSTPITKLILTKNEEKNCYEWESGRDLSKGLLSFMKEKLNLHENDFTDLSGLGVYKGPGSFTGLRIGITVMNTLADSLGIPIVGETGENWLDAAQKRLDNTENDKIILPHYGAEAHITVPRK